MWVSKQQSHIVFFSGSNQPWTLASRPHSRPLHHHHHHLNSLRRSRILSLSSQLWIQQSFNGEEQISPRFIFDETVFQSVCHSRSVVTLLISPGGGVTWVPDLLLLLVLLVVVGICVCLCAGGCASQPCIVCESRGCDALVRTHYIKCDVHWRNEAKDFRCAEHAFMRQQLRLSESHILSNSLCLPIYLSLFVCTYTFVCSGSAAVVMILMEFLIKFGKNLVVYPVWKKLTSTPTPTPLGWTGTSTLSQVLSANITDIVAAESFIWMSTYV